ncbi:MAG TPA: hypothetical protein VGJ69_09345 [Pyrinomonadaceae bacterium]|jgi:hypothetical protein
MRINPDKSVTAGQLVTTRQSLFDAIDDVTGDYLIFVPLAAFSAICLIAITRASTTSAQLLLIVVFALLLVASWFTYRTIQRSRKLFCIHTGLSPDANLQLSLRAIESTAWNIIERHKSYLCATTRSSGFTWGQEITLIFADGDIYVNCRNSVGGAPSARSPFDFGRCRRCIDEFRAHFDIIRP